MAPSAILPTYFLSHGGGPWPWMKKELGAAYDVLEASLKDIPRQIDAAPKAILMISGHWEERDFTVMASPHPPMIYDYGGFPEHTYHISYPAPGAPVLAEHVRKTLSDAGFAAASDPERGFDHGTYAPLAAMYPKADMPVVQLSLRRNLDPKEHLQAGKALAPLRKEGVLILGSGLSYHNLRALGGAGAKPASQAFDTWLTETLTAEPGEREARLIDWAKAPAARQAHPREDHLIPLMVAVGAAAEEPAERIYHEENFFGNTVVSSYRFGKNGATSRS